MELLGRMHIGNESMRLPSPRWNGLLPIVFLILAGCAEPAASPTALPILAPAQIPTIAATPTPAIIWSTDGWQYSTLEEQGLDSAILEQMSQDIRANVHAARSNLVYRNAYLVYEEYFKGDESYAGPVYSVSKSFFSGIIGIALEEGHIRDIKDRLFDYIGEYDTEVIDPCYDEITIELLLTMTAGFGYFPVGASSVPAAFREELVSRPGEEAAYNSTSTHLLSAIVSEAAGVSALEMAEDRIFSPLGIPKPIWSADGFRISMGGYGLYLKPRDMAKYGYLYLIDGQWDGEQIIPTDWVESSTRTQAEIGISELTGFADFGYLWWVLPLGKYQAFSAFGAGGQMIMVVPKAELVVVSTTDSPLTMNMVDKEMQFMIQALAVS